MNIEQIESQLDRFEGFLKQDPENIKLISDVADLRMQLGKLEEAKQILNEGIKLDPDNSALLFRQATAAMMGGELDRAIEQYQALLLKEDNPVIRFNLAYALTYSGQYEEAKSQLELIPNADVSLPDALLLKSRVLHHLGDVESAIKCATEYYEVRPDNSEVAGVLALLHLDGSQFEQATEWARKALEVDSDNLEALVTLGSVALEEQDETTARRDFTHAVARHPKSGRAWSGMGLTDMLASNLPEAIEDLKKAVKYMPTHIGTWHALAWCQIVTDDIDGAEESLNHAMDLDRNFGETHGGLAIIAILRGEYEKAEGLAKRSIRLAPNSFSGRFALSLLLEHKGNMKEARKVINNILNYRFADNQPTLQQNVVKALRQRK